MAPTNFNHQQQRMNENMNPQQQQQQRHPNAYANLTRKAPTISSSARLRPSVIATTMPPAGRIDQRRTSFQSTSPAESSGISPTGSAAASVNSYASFTRRAPAGASTGSRTSLSSGTIIRDIPHSKTSTTGIERSYEGVTRTIQSVASFGSGGSSSNNTTGGRGGRKIGAKSSGSSRGGKGASTRPVVASSDYDSYHAHHSVTTSSQVSPRSSRAFSNTHLPPNPISSLASASSSCDHHSTASSRVIGSHLQSLSLASMSMDEFEQLRKESKLLKMEHESKFGDGSSVVAGGGSSSVVSRSSVAFTSGGARGGTSRGIVSAKATSHKESSNKGTFGHSTSTKVISNKTAKKQQQQQLETIQSVRNMQGTTTRASSSQGRYSAGTTTTSTSSTAGRNYRMSTGSSGSRTSSSRGGGGNNNNRRSTASSGMYTAKLGREATLDKRVSKGVQHGLSKFAKFGTKMLHVNSSDNDDDDAMSFYCSDGVTGGVVKQKVRTSEGASSDRGPNSANTCDMGTSLPQSELLVKSVKKVSRKAAKGVSKIARESGQGLGMLMTDMAQQHKTPARDNRSKSRQQQNKGGVVQAGGIPEYHHGVQQQQQLTGMGHDGRYEDYVHDPEYKVVFTPPAAAAAFAANNAILNAGKTPYANGLIDNGIDPTTPGCLLGAVTAGRCNLSPSNPESLDFLPKGIPRVLVVHEDWEERAGFIPVCALLEGQAGVDGGVVAVTKSGNHVLHNANGVNNNVDNRRISNPIDIDEETETMNGEEVDAESLAALRQGLPSPRENQSALANGTGVTAEEEENVAEEEDAVNASMWVVAPNDDDSSSNEDDSSKSGDEESDPLNEGEEDDPRNASMWVVAPADIDEDDDLDEVIPNIGDINLSEMFNHDSEQYELTNSDKCTNDVDEFGNKILSVNTDDDTRSLVELARDYGNGGPLSPLITPTFSVATEGESTFFVGDVQLGFEDSKVHELLDDDDLSTVVKQEEEDEVFSIIRDDDEESQLQSVVEEDEDDDESTVVKEEEESSLLQNNVVEEEVQSQYSEEVNPNDITQVHENKAPIAVTKIEDLDIYQELPQDPVLANDEEDSLASLAKSTTSAVVHNKASESTTANTDKAKEFQTPYSVKKGERPLSFSEFKTMNKQVLFDMGNEDSNNSIIAQELYGTQELKWNTSDSTELSHEPPVRMVNSGTQELYSNPSGSTDLSVISNPSGSTDLSVMSNWAAPKDQVAVQQNMATPTRQSNDTSKSKDGKRQLKGRVILVRIKKKVSKVARKMLFLPFKSKKTSGAAVFQQGDRGDQLSITNGDNQSHVVSNSSVPATPYGIHQNPQNPASPSYSESGSSIASSIMTGSNASATKRIIGAVPPKAGSPSAQQQALYGGIITYGVHSPGGDSTVSGSDALPPPPGSMYLPHQVACNDDEDAVSYLAEAMRHAQEEDGEEDSVLLLVTPKDDGTEEITQVISTAPDGTPLQVRDIIEAGAYASDEDEDIGPNSEVKPNNLACLFTDEKGNSTIQHGTPIQIMDAVEVDGGIILTPQNVNQNVANVFRPSTDASSANLLPSSVLDSDDEDESLLYHDGCTVIKQCSTFGDNTIATMNTANKEDDDTVSEDQAMAVKEEEEKKAVVSASYMGIGTPILSPAGPTLSKQAAANGSFLFSPNNMGRANPIIRKKERASLKNGEVPPSITMLPSVAAAIVAKTRLPEASNSDALVLRQSYSFESAANNSKAESVDVVDSVERDISAILAPESKTKILMSSLKDDRQFSFKTTRTKFSSADASPPQKAAPSSFDEMKTPLVTNTKTGEAKTQYPVTPFPGPEQLEASNDCDASSPVVDSLLIPSTSPLSTNPMSKSPMSVTSTSSYKSGKGRGKKASPKYKSVPKSALRTRKGFVQDRVSDIHQRIDINPNNGATTSVNGLLKRNHSYRYQKPRRMTNGNGALAPKHAVLQSTYIRSVPIGIVKSYSRDSTVNGSSYDEEDVKEKEATSYAFKYTSKPIDSFDEVSPTNSLGAASLASNGRPASAGSISDASSYVSESDPFSTLLGKMASEEEDDSSCSEDEDEGLTNLTFGKENTSNIMEPTSSSPSASLPFKSSGPSLVKPTELNSHEVRAPLSPVPQRAQLWRTMAAQSKQSSSRFRSENSWRQVAGSPAVRD